MHFYEFDDPDSASALHAALRIMYVSSCSLVGHEASPARHRARRLPSSQGC
jgi:hypothetical protein